MFRNKIPEPCWIPEEPHQPVYRCTIGAGRGCERGTSRRVAAARRRASPLAECINRVPKRFSNVVGQETKMFQIGSRCGANLRTNQIQEPRPTPLPADQKPRQGVEHKGAGSPIVSAWRDMRLESRTCAAALTRGLQRTSQPISVNVSVFGRVF